MTRLLHLKTGIRQWLPTYFTFILVVFGGFQTLHAQLQATLNVTDAVCFGLPNGRIIAVASNGTPAYNFQWSNGATGATATGLAAGTYSVTVTDAAGQSIVRSATVNQPALVNAVLTVDELCNAPFNITANPSGGIAPYNYNWSNGGMTQTIANVPAGQYCVTVTDANLCGVPVCITVNANPPTVSVQATHVTCPGGTNGSVTAVHIGGVPPYTYVWSNGGVGQTLNNLGAGSYTVTLTDGNGCTAVATGTVTQPPAISINLNRVNPTCVGDTNGSITSAISGGTPPYTLSWNTGASTPNLTNLGPGTYTLTVVDVRGCTQTASISLAYRSNLTLGGLGTPVTCPGLTNGFATANPQNGVMPYTYLWSNGWTQQVVMNAAPGNYSVTVTDAVGCTATTVVVVPAAPAFTVAASGSNPTTCGVNNGTATVNVLQGIGPFTYRWNTGATTQSISNLGAGTYTVTVTNGNNCTTSSSTTLVAPPNVFVSATATPRLCPGVSNGTATATASGGTPPFSYAWSNGGNTQTITGLSPGNYSVIVTDANGCTSIASVTIQQAPGVTFNLTGTTIVCGLGNTGSATAIPTGGTAPFSYVWSTGAVTSSVTGLLEGTYSVTVTDANGCTAVRTITINVIDDLSVNLNGVNPDCFGFTNGSVTALPSGGNAPYNYVWNTGSTTQQIINRGAGTYSATVTDANGCTAQRSISLTQPPLLTASIQATNPLNCFGAANASLTATAQGGTPAYSYAWSNGLTGPTISNLPAGTYTVTVTDTNECTATATFVITQTQAISVNITGQSVYCGAENSGFAGTVVSGGTGPYNYTWNTGAITESINNIPNGTYSVTVTDANGCTGVASRTIRVISNLGVNLIPRNVLCFGDNSGSVLAIPSGGDMPYTFRWNTGSLANEITNIVAGTYSVTLTEANGCTVQGSVVVNQPTLLTASATRTNPGCPGTTNGTATVTANGGTAPYQYAWSSGGSTSSLTGLGAGTYTVTVTDINLCTTTASVTLTNPQGINVNVSAPTITCGGTASGTATAIATGGTGVFTYLWSNSQITQTATNLAAGTYSVTVTDGNGCTQVASGITVSELPAVQINFNITNLECTSAPVGAVTATASNGTAPYSYAWSNGRTTATINNLAPGIYTLTVTDANGCRAVRSAEIRQTAGFTAGVPGTMVTCFGANNGSATVVTTGGQAPFAYIWSNSLTTQSINNLAPGTYSVTVTDANECFAVASVVITQPALLVANISGTNILCNGDANGTVSVSPTGGTPPYTIAWNTGQTAATITVATGGTYTVTVTDANGCVATNSRVITEPTPLNVTITQNSGTCSNVTQGILVANVTGGTTGYTYRWSNGATTQTASNLAPGTYMVTVTDANGCVRTATAALTTFPAPSCSVTVLQTSTLGNNGSVRVNVTSGTAPFTYNWSNGGNTAILTSLAPGTYTVTVSDVNGCQTVCSATLMPLAGIGNYVWEDIDHDGQQDANEPAIPNVTVNLKNAAGTVIATTTTDANGEYYFLGLAPGTYSVQFVVPAGMDYTASNLGNDALDSDIVPGMNGMTGTYTLDPGELDFTVDAGLFVPPNGGIIDPCTCLNNNTTEDDGQFDELFQITSYPNETWTVIAGSGLYRLDSPAPPAAPINVQLPLVLNEVSPGVYSFNFLLVDDITYTATITNGFSTFNISNTCAYPTLNLEPAPPLDLCITDPVVELGSNPTSPGTLVFTVNGVVVNEIDPMNLGIGVYELVATFSPTDPTQCEVTIISTVNIHDDCVAKLGNYVWEDIDHDGQQDGFEPAVPNVTVNLKNASGVVVNTTTTNALGEYCFYPLQPGTYSVQFVIPNGFDYTSSNQGNDALDSDIVPGMNGMTGTVVLQAGDENLTVDGGIYVPPNGVIGDPCSCLNNSTDEDNGQFTETFTVRSYPNETWRVIGGSGMYLLASDEPPVLPIPVTYPFVMEEHEPGVYEYTFRLVDELTYTVYATNGFDTLSISNTCEYPVVNINELPPATLCLADAPIQLGANPAIPGNMIFTINGVIATEIDPLELNVGSYLLVATLIPLDPRECEATIETQFTITEDCLATVGDRVWLDLNCDGVQGGNEPGIPGVEVRITGTAEFLDPNVDLVTYTNAQGNFSFNVPPGNYKLTFGTVPGYNLTAPNQGGDDNRDSDVNPLTMMTDFFHLDPYEVNYSFDMGLCPECINVSYPGAIGNDQYLCAPGNDPAPFVSLAPASGGDGPVEYMWMYTNGFEGTPIQYWTPIPNSNSLTYDAGPLQLTTFFARCARTENCGTFLETNVIEVTVGNETQAVINGPGLVCWNQPTTFTAAALEPGSTVVWHFTGGATPATVTGPTATVTWSSVGIFQVELQVTHDGCTATAYKTITITTNPTTCNQGLQISSTATNPDAGEIMVSWEMSSLVTGLTYEVEHAPDGVTFERIAVINEATRQQNGVQFFEHYSIAPKKGINYYRVKVVDAAGASIYSNIAEVILYEDSKIAMLYPNPVNDRLYVEIFETFGAQEIFVEVFSVSGKRLSSIPVAQDARQLDLDFARYPAGAYMVRLRLGETNIRTMKVIKR